MHIQRKRSKAEIPNVRIHVLIVEPGPRVVYAERNHGGRWVSLDPKDWTWRQDDRIKRKGGLKLETLLKSRSSDFESVLFWIPNHQIMTLWGLNQWILRNLPTRSVPKNAVSGTGMRQWPRSTYGVMNHEPRDAWTCVLGQLGFPVSPMENFEQLQTDMFFWGWEPTIFVVFLQSFCRSFSGDDATYLCGCCVQDLHIHCRYTVEAIPGDSKRCKRGIFWARFRKCLGVWRDGSRLAMVAAETLKCLSKSEN